MSSQRQRVSPTIGRGFLKIAAGKCPPRTVVKRRERAALVRSAEHYAYGLGWVTRVVWFGGIRHGKG